MRHTCPSTLKHYFQHATFDINNSFDQFLSPNLWFPNIIPWFITRQALWFGVLVGEKGLRQSLHLQSTTTNPVSVFSCFDRYGKEIFFLNPSGTTEIPLYILFQCDVLEPAVPGHSCQGRQLLWTGSTGWRSQHTAVWYPWWRSVGDPLHSQSATTQLKYKIIHEFY